MIRKFLFLFIVSSFSIQAQDPYHILYTIDDGLPSEEVYDVYVDDDDIVWFTTDRGVGRYNGYEFENFSTSDGLAYNTNYKMFPDDKKRIWFFGSDGSISIYDNGQFSKFMHSDNMNNESDKFLYALGYDSLGHYFTHYTDFKTNNGVFSYFVISDSSEVNEVMVKNESLTENIDSTCIVHHFDNTNFIYLPQYKDFATSSIKIDQNSGLCIYPLSHRLRKSDIIKTKKWSQLFKYENEHIEVLQKASFPLISVFKDAQGNIFVCSAQGIFLYRKGDLTQEPEHFFKGKEFSDIYQDKAGNYWISSNKDGLYFVPTFESKIFDFDSNERTVSYLFPIDSTIAFLFKNEFINYIDYKGESQPLLNKPDDVTDFKVVKHYHNGRQIVKSDNNYYKHNIPTGRYIMAGFLGLSNGDTLIGRTKVIVLRDGKIIFNSKKTHVPTNSHINCVKEHNGDIWYSTMRSFFHIPNFDYDNPIEVSKINDLLKVRINDFELDENGNRWLATIGNGLLYHYSDNQIIQFDKTSGLISNQLNTILMENDTTIWIGTNKGIDKIIIDNSEEEPKIRSIANFGVRDGLLSNFINEILIKDDKIWVASKEGFQSIQLLENNRDILPSIKINKVHVFENEVDTLTLSNLKHDENFISFTYEGVSYNKPENSFYKYKLTKINDSAECNYTDDRIARFTNLNPGKYTFWVSASNKNGEWTSPVAIKFTILPHFTATWWFFLLCLLLLGTIAYYLYSRRLHYLIAKSRQERTLQEAKMRTKIAELSTFRNQFNPHFIFNSLNSIQAYIFKKDVKQANRFLSRFSKLIRESLNLSDQKYVSIEKEFNFLKTYLEMEFLRFPDKFNFEFHNDENLELNVYQIPPLLMQPAVENVVKHAFKGQEIGKLDIFIKSNADNNSLILTIEDNGTGFKKDDQSETKNDRKSFGMKIIYDRIKLLNIDFPHVKSSCTITNRTNKSGTIVKFVIPIFKID